MLLILISNKNKQVIAIKIPSLKICIIKLILLAATIFSKHNFVLCFWHVLNLIKKLGFKTKNIKNDLIKKRIR